MARPRTTSKPRKSTNKKVEVITAEDGREIVKVQGSTGMDVPQAKAEKIMAAHVAGVPVTQICRAFNTSYHTVVALVRNRPELLEKARSIAANNWKTLAAIGTAELFDRLPDMKDHALTVMSAIATEKSELLSGGATQRVEHVMAPAADDWQNFVSGLRKSAEVVDVAFEPVGTPAAGPQKAAELPPGGADRDLSEVVNSSAATTTEHN
jgi:hypothetical protein